MNMENKTSIYTVNDAPPPSYAEATTASAPGINNSQFDQRYPHTVVHPPPSVPFPYPFSPNYYPGTAPVQLTYPEYESAERQSQPTGADVTYNTSIIGKTENNYYSKIGRVIGVIAILMSIGVLITLISRGSRHM